MEGLTTILIVKIIAGIVLLVAGGEFLVTGGLGVARHHNVSNLFIGLTIVAFGTSAPELFVSLSAALTGHHALSAGIVIGSNLANIGLAISFLSIISPLVVAPKTIKRSWPVLLFSGIVLILVMLNSAITHAEGACLIAILIAIVTYSYYATKKEGPNTKPLANKNVNNSWLSYILLFLSAASLGLGSNFLINSATEFAKSIPISEPLVALTIVSIGTTVPEIVVAIIALRKNEPTFAAGALIGSSIFNVFAVVGLTASFQTLRISFPEFKFSVLAMIIFYLVLFIFIFPFKTFWLSGNSITSRFQNMPHGKISRLQGAILIILYVCYLFIIINKYQF